MEDIFRLGKTQLGLFNRPYKRYFLREIDLNRRSCIILGQQGASKTTAMVQHLLERAGDDLDSEKILYVQSDHFLIGRRLLGRKSRHLSGSFMFRCHISPGIHSFST